MTEYQDAAHEAYRRLKHQEMNRPPAEEVARFELEAKKDERRQKMARFRRSIA